MDTKKHCKLNNVEAGMTLADDVLDTQGHCLMTAGVTLTATMLESLQQRGIEVLTVWQTQALSESEKTEQRAIIKARLAHRFRQMQDNPDMCQLYDLLLDWYLQPFAQSEQNNEQQP